MAQTFSTQTEYRAFPNQLPTELFAFRRRAWCHSHRRDREEGIGVFVVFVLRSQLRVPMLMEAVLTGIHSSETSDLTRAG